MASNTSLITEITGLAWVRGADGALSPLQAGMRIPADADVVTASGASVQLQMDGQPPLTIGEQRDVQLGAEVAQADVDPATSAAAAPSAPDTAAILAALAAGDDPLDNLDPTAAVIQGGGPGDGGSSFTRLAAVLELTTPLGLEYPRPIYPRTEEIRLGGVGSNRAPELTGGALTGAGLLDQVNDDSDMVAGLNVGQHFTDPDGHDLAFTATGLPPGLTLNPITGVIEGKLDSSASQGGPGGDGVYNVVITATDPYGSSVDLPFTWTTHNPPPVAEDDVATTEENTVVEGNVLTGDANGNGADVDPDGDKLTVTEITNADGDKVSAGKPITGENSDGGKGGGTFTINPDGSYTFNPGKDFDYLADGESTTTKVTYKISDGDGGYDEATLTITVTGTNDAPTLNPDVTLGDKVSVDAEEIDPVDVSGQFTDIDGDDLTFSATGLPPGLNMDEKGVITGVLDKSASQGGPDSDGKYTIVVTAQDPSGATIDQTFTWDVSNPAPVANDDVNETEENTIAIGNVLTGDSQGGIADVDPDGDKLTVTEITNGNGDKVPAGTPITGVNKDGSKGGGTFTINPDGSYSFDPGTDFDYLAVDKSTTTQVTYKINDGEGGYAEATLTITVTGTNDAPTLNSDVTLGDKVSVDAEEIDPVDVSGQFTDIDGDELTFSATGLPPGLSMDENGVITGTLDKSASQGGPDSDGKYTIVVTAKDPSGATIDQTFTWDVSNPAPVANPDVNTTEENMIATGNVLTGDASGNGADVDPDGDKLTVTEIVSDGKTVDAGKPITGENNDDGKGGGTFIINPDGSYTFDPGTDFDYLAVGESTTTQVTYKISDGEGGLADATLTITVTGTNDLPIANADTNTVVESGVALGGNDIFKGKESATGNVLSNDTDLDDSDVLSVSGVYLGPDANGTAATKDGASFKLEGTFGNLVLNEDGSYVYALGNDNPEVDRLALGDTRTEVFTYEVTDKSGAKSSTTLIITVTGTNDAPVITSSPVDAQGVVVEAGNNADGSEKPGQATATGQLTSDDVDVGAEATWSIQGTAEGKYGSIEIDPKTGKWTYTLDNDRKETQALKNGQEETETFIARVQDEHGAWVEQVVTVTVHGTNDAPTAEGEKVIFDEDPTQGVDGKSQIGNVLTNDSNPEGGSLTVKEFTIEGDAKLYNAGETADIDGVGKFVLNEDGSYVFTPLPNYSGAVPKITYTVQEPSGEGTGEDGLTASADLEFVITPVADAPNLGDPKDTQTREEVEVELGLKAPEVTDKTDHNGAGKGDNPELLGLITLSGIPAGVQLLDDAGNVVFTSDGSDITINLSDGHLNGNGHIAGAKGQLTLTKEQFESLKVNPVKDDSDNFTVKVSVDSYEVDGSGKPLDGIPPANTTVDIIVDVRAVTDTVELEFKDGANGSFEMNEDARFDLTGQLKAEFEDLDGSEQREIVISGLPAGSTVFVDGKAIAADDNGNFIITATGQTGGIDSFPKIEISPPQDFSGDMDNIKVTLNAQDFDKDSFHGDKNHQGKVESSEVTLNLHVKPIAGDVHVGGVTGSEDSAINFLANVKLTDLDGSETITKFVIKGVPEGWVVRDASGTKVFPDADGNYVLDAGTLNTTTSGYLKNYEGWTVTPPAHSSKDATFTLGIETTDKNTEAGEVSVVDKDYSLKVTVTPEAEKIPDADEKDPTVGDTDGDKEPDLTMTGGHTYNKDLAEGQEKVAGAEDEWFAINQDGFDLKGGWSNQDGQLANNEKNPESADGGTEETFALLTPELVDGVSGESAAGSKFSYTGPDGEVVLTYNGVDPVEIPMEYLDTVKFQGPPNVSGTFEIGIQAKTVDTDPDSGEISEAISGNAKLEGIFIAPVADKVTLGIGGAHGKEDMDIPLIIRPASDDPSETFNVEISGIPDGAVLTYDGVELVVENGKVKIENFDSGKTLTVKPPHNSDQDFDLTVKAQSVDTVGNVTVKSELTESQITVRVDGVADEVKVTFKPTTLTEDAFGTAGADGKLDNTIKLEDIIAKTEMHDGEDGSEILSFKITGLPEGFTVEGATFMGGEGIDREWTFTADQLGNITIKVPEHYSGTLPGTLTPVTTEKGSGDSWTGKPLDWNVTITPSPESDMVSSTTVSEDTLTKLDFRADTSHGDTDETLTTLWIRAEGADGKDFTLFLGQGDDQQTLKDAAEKPGSGVILENGYYKLTGDSITNVYVKPDNNFSGDLTLDVKYEITDYATDNSGLSSKSGVKGGQHTIIVTPVTDEVELELNKPAAKVEGVGSFGVEVTLTKKEDGNAEDERDHDGSEQFTQVFIEGVPKGMLVEGLKVGGTTFGNVSYLGNGKWLISIPKDEYPSFKSDEGIKGEVQFKATESTESLTGNTITITVDTKDGDKGEIKFDSENWTFDTSGFGGGPGDQSSVDVTWEKNQDFNGLEDTSFTLGEAFTGTIAQNGPDGSPVAGSAEANFTIVLALSPGSKVTDGEGNEITSTIIDGKEVWVLTGKGQQQLDDYLNDIHVTPPANLNDNADDKFKFEVDFTGHLDNGKQSETDFGKEEGDYLPLQPVSDKPVIDIEFAAVGTGGKPQEGSDVAITLKVSNGVDANPSFGDSVYIKVGEGGLDGGALKDANGKPLTETISITDPNNAQGLPVGDYYVVPMPEDGKVDLIYTPPADKKYTSGDLDIEAWVQGKEEGADSWITGGGTTTGKVGEVNNGYNFTVGSQESEDAPWVVNGFENNADSTAVGDIKGAISLGNNPGSLIDTDGSEQALSAMLKNLPNGFLVYYKVGEELVLASNAGKDADGNNAWLLPMVGGKLPEIFVQPPQNWSGTLNGLDLSVLSGEKGKETWGDSNKFDLVVNPVADGILSFNPAPAFGKEGDIIQLNLNIVMKDDLQAGVTDQSVETITVTLAGLGQHAAFYVDGKLLGGVHYDAGSDTYTASGLSQSDADKLGFIQAAGAAKDKITVTVETVESDNSDSSGRFEKDGSTEFEFDLKIFDQPATSGNDELLYGGGLLDGGDGDDTIWLRFGEDLDFSDAATSDTLKNIEVLDLTKGFIGKDGEVTNHDHQVLKLGADDVFKITDGRNSLTINADKDDTVSFKNEEWTLNTDRSTKDYDVYTAKTSDGKNVEVHITKDFDVDGILLDDTDSQSIDSLLDDSGVSPAKASAGGKAGSASAYTEMDHGQQNQLINDLIQQGKLTTDTQ